MTEHVSINDIQEMTDVSRRTVYKWTRSESFPALVAWKRWDRVQVEQWLAVHTKRRYGQNSAKSEAVIVRIRELYLETFSVSGTAKQLGISKATVYKYAADLIEKGPQPRQFHRTQ